MLQLKTLKVNLYNTREREKRSCNQRIIEPENGSFASLVFACTFAMSKECGKFCSYLKVQLWVGYEQNCPSNYYTP